MSSVKVSQTLGLERIMDKVSPDQRKKYAGLGNTQRIGCKKVSSNVPILLPWLRKVKGTFCNLAIQGTDFPQLLFSQAITR